MYTLFIFGYFVGRLTGLVESLGGLLDDDDAVVSLPLPAEMDVDLKSTAQV